MKKTLAFILTLAMILSICIFGQYAFADSDPITIEEPSSGEVVRGGTLILAKELESQTGLDVTTIDYMECHYGLLSLIYEPLLTIAEDGSVAPGLASEWAFSDDGLSLVLKLREDVSFTNGEKFNAEAAAKTINYYKFDCQHALATNLETVENAEVVDEYTVKINLNSLDSNLEYNLSSSIGMMVAPELIDKKDLSVPVGTGPFVLSEYKEGEYALVTANPNYYKMGVDGQPLPYLDAIKFIVMTDDITQITNLKSGDIMGIDKVLSTTSAISVEDSDSLYLIENGGNCQVANLALNLDKESMSNLKLRQAILYATNNEELVEIGFEGFGETRKFWSPEGCWFYNDYNPYTYNVEKAKELMAEAGLENGVDLELAIIAREPDATFAQIVQYQLGEIGINVSINALDSASWVSYVRENHDHDMTLANVSGSGFAPSTYWRFILKAIGGGQVVDDLNAILDKTVETLDVKDRKALIDEYQNILMDEAAYAPIGAKFNYAAFNNSVKNVTVNYWGWLELANAYIEK